MAQTYMSTMPTVSVCIANYNGMSIIDACLRSVLNQDCDFPIEIIVHDDASTDESATHIRKYYPDAVLIESTQNVGFCISNNRMVNAANGKYILLLNNDAELFPDALRILREKAAAIQRPAILGLPQYDAANGTLIDIGSCFDPFLNPVPNRDPSRHNVGMVIGACLWVPRSLWEELGGFPDW
ncbi:MAG TPA: glycosyltransferase, partial [Burkholderiaceae bacterium]